MNGIAINDHHLTVLVDANNSPSIVSNMGARRYHAAIDLHRCGLVDIRDNRVRITEEGEKLVASMKELIEEFASNKGN